MKQGIHPKYEPTVIRCACGAEFETRSTKKDLRVEICSKCHPFFTGRQKLVDTGGRVDRFNKRFGLNNKSGSDFTLTRQCIRKTDCCIAFLLSLVAKTRG